MMRPQIIMSIFTLCALIFILMCILGGYAALPGNPVVLVRKDFVEMQIFG